MKNKKLTKEDILSFPITSYGRAIGKQLSAKVVNELLQYKVLEEQIGCPLEIRERALKQCENEGLYFETEDTDGFVRKGMYQCILRYDGFNKRFYWNCIWNAETWLDCYKKTWWLKKDRSE